jgi:hypothetical protein
MGSKDLQSIRYDFNNDAEAIEFYYARGWTDGLPIIPPTKDGIQTMLEAVAFDPDHEITCIEERRVSITAEKVAINAVMAGCKPDYMPVIVAALEAMGDPLWSYHGPATSTGGAAVFMLVNGPIARELDLNCGDNLFGPGWRANATIGRAVRLVMRNVIGTLPGRLDRSTLGHAGKFTFCIAENEEESPWPPVHVELGFRPEQNTITVLAALAPHQFYNQLSNTPEGILATACAHMRISPGAGNPREYVLVLAGEHTRVMSKEGWSKDDIRQFCFEHTKTSLAELKRIHAMPGEIHPGDETRLQSVVAGAGDFIIVAAGGKAGAFSCYIPAWSSKRSSQSVTKEIRRP